MPDYRRASVPGGSYFFTLVTARRQSILTRRDIRQALREAIEVVRSTQPLRIDAWVLLPDHLHRIWTLPPGHADFSTVGACSSGMSPMLVAIATTVLTG